MVNDCGDCVLCMNGMEALNLRFNQMTRVGAKYLLDVMHEFNILRLVDLRGNEDDKVLGVLENGEHYTSFSTFQVNLLDLAYNETVSSKLDCLPLLSAPEASCVFARNK